MSIVLKHGEMINAAGQIQSFESLEIRDGKFVSMNTDAKAEQVIDCRNKLLIPALTDLGMNITSPGDLATELFAAAAGGVGRVCLLPSTSPVNDTPAISKLLERQANKRSGANLLLIGAMTKGLEGKLLSEYAELKDAGCIALSNVFNNIESLAVTKRCFDYAHTFDLPIFMHPMESSLYQGCMHAGALSTTLGLKGIPEIAETTAIAQLCILAKASGVHLHFSNVSCADSVALILEAKEKGARISADAAIANLCYTDQAVEGFNSQFHTIPPLRSEQDRLALIQGVNEGVIDAITSGHTPRSRSSKNAPFAESAKGMSTIEHLLHYASQLDARNEIPLTTFIEAMNKGASRVINLKPNVIDIGESADFCILNRTQGEAHMSNHISNGENSPLDGMPLNAYVEHTFIAGALTYSRA